MTVKITLEYGSVEEAIVALGRMAQVAKVRRAAQGMGGVLAPEEERTNKAATLASVAPATKKPRGRPRKEEAEAPSAPEIAAAEPAQASVTAASAPSEAAAPAASSVPTEADAKAALAAYFEKNGPQRAMAQLASFGVSRLRDLPEGERAKFIASCQ